MFKPSSAPVSVLEAPCQITIEFTDYASYQHHQFRQQQYQQQLELQEQKRRQEEDHRQYEAHLRSHFQNQLQSQIQFQPAYQHSLPMNQSPAFPAPFEQQLPSELPSELPSDIPSELPSELPSDYRLLVYQQQQERPGQHHLEVVAHGRSHSLAETSLINANAGVQEFPNHGPVPAARPSASSGIFVYENGIGEPGYVEDMETRGQEQLFPANGTAPSPINPLAHTPSTTLAISTFPVISPPVSSDSDIQHLEPGSPTFFTATPPPNSMVDGLQHLRRPHHHHLNHNSLNRQPFHQHPGHSYTYHQHLQQQIQERRTKRAQTFPIAPPSVYALSDPSHVGGVNSHPSQLLQHHQLQYHHQQPEQQQHQQQQQPDQTDLVHEHGQYPTAHLIYPPYHTAAMPVDFEQITALDQDAIAAEIAAQEAAAQSYRPDTEGPGIDEIHPVEDLQKLYTNADPSFVEKTQKLPRAFPLYRPVRGDGNCGWRAIGFCYFEILVHSGNADLIAEERARLLGLNGYIRNVGGYDPYVYEDMVEETDILFGNIINVYPDLEKAMEAVSAAFNDAGASNAIIYHLRLLAASYLKENAEKYDGFLAHDMGVIGYCQEWIERPNCEIDHLRMELLTNVLLKSSDMVLEIAYLDRSEGAVLPTYRFPESNIGRRERTIVRRMSLLFRPDHYDILYRPSQPSRAVAEAVLSRFHTPEHVATALTLDWARSATIVAGEPATPEVEVVDDSVALAEPTAAAAFNSLTPAQSDAYPINASLSVYEDTPDLTPGSSNNSPAYFQLRGEPLTPVLAPTSGPPQAEPATILAVSGNGSDGILGVATAAAVAQGLAPGAGPAAGGVGETGELGGLGGAAAGAGPTSVDAVTPHPASSKRIKLDGGSGQSTGEGQASTAPASSPTAPDVPSSTDYKVFHVGDITYGNTSSSQAHPPDFGAGMDLFSQLPFLFGNAPSEPNSALFGTGNWSSSALRARFSDTFAASLMTSHPATEAPGQPARANAAIPAAVPAARPASDAMAPAPPAAASSAAEPHQESPPQPAGGSISSDVQREPVMRFTQWHYEGKKTAHDAMDRGSISFRSKMRTAAHFCSSQFQPDVYKPTGSEGPARGDGRHGDYARFDDHEQEDALPDSQWQ